MTAPPVAGTHRARILDYLATHPGATSTQIRRALGVRSQLTDLLRDMVYRGELVAGSTWRADQGRNVSLWHVAPPGTIPPPRPAPDPAAVRRHRERETRLQRARRARRRGETSGPCPVAPPLPRSTPPCTDNPALFFPGTEAEEAQAIAICRGCPFRTPCFERALANGERWGVWGGQNFERSTRTERTKAS